MNPSGMSRALVILILVFIGFDAAVCPAVCLATNAATHQTSGVPSHGTGSQPACGGACWSGVTASPVDSSVVLTERSARVFDHRAELPSRSPVADIDHPPRLG